MSGEMTINVTNYPALSSGDVIAPKYCIHAVDVSFGGATPEWYRLGEDLEEFRTEMNPDISVTKNILGSSSFQHNGYEPSADIDPLKGRVGDKLFDKLQYIADTQGQAAATKSKLLEAHLWKSATVDSATVYEATTQNCHIVPNSTGSDTESYQIPASINLVGEKTMGAFTPPATGASSGTFTPGTWTESDGTWTFTPAS